MLNIIHWRLNNRFYSEVIGDLFSPTAECYPYNYNENDTISVKPFSRFHRIRPRQGRLSQRRHLDNC